MEGQTKLYEAALKGDVNSLLKLLQEDPFILDRCMGKSSCFMQSPLHVAAKMGHKEILETFLERKPNMIFAGDEDGRTLIHVAAMNGHTHVFEMLHRANPYATRARTNRGETALHLCIKHNQAGALQHLLNYTDDELLNSKDGDGNTVLHLAVIGQQLQMLEKMLMQRKNIAKNEVNKNELTALDSHISILENERREGYYEIIVSLENAKALRGKDALKRKNIRNWVVNQSNALMIVASLITTMAFQVGVNPPGGFWEDTKLSKHNTIYSRIAGTPILYDNFKQQFKQMMVSNTIALVSSLSVILLFISGLPYGRKFVAILMITMWIAITATTATYALSLAMTLVPNGTDPTKRRKPNKLITCVWIIMMVILLLGHALYFLVKYIRRKPTLLPPKFLKQLGVVI